MSVFAKSKAVNKVFLISMEYIQPNPNQPRKTFHEGELRSLAESISANGLLQPITLRKESDTLYYIIAGERRFIACKQTGLKNIPAIICNVSLPRSRRPEGWGGPNPPLPISCGCCAFLLRYRASWWRRV